MEVEMVMRWGLMNNNLVFRVISYGDTSPRLYYPEFK